MKLTSSILTLLSLASVSIFGMEPERKPTDAWATKVTINQILLDADGWPVINFTPPVRSLLQEAAGAIKDSPNLSTYLPHLPEELREVLLQVLSKKFLDAWRNQKFVQEQKKIAAYVKEIFRLKDHRSGLEAAKDKKLEVVPLIIWLSQLERPVSALGLNDDYPDDEPLTTNCIVS